MAEALPSNTVVAEQFELLADLLEIEGAESFRVAAYRRAAARIRDTGSSVAQLALEGKAKQLQGIGKTIEEKIVQIVEDGEIHALAERRERIPEDVARFAKLPGLGPKTAARLWLELGITTLAQLEEAARAQRLRTVSGFAAKSEERILKALAERRERAPEQGRRLLGEALPATLGVVAALREHPAAVEVSEAGSVRRRRETVHDIDLIATATDPPALTETFCRFPWVVEVVAHGDTKATVVSDTGLVFDLRVVPPEAYGSLLQHFTGSKEHNIALREDAQRRGLSVSEYGVLVEQTGERLAFRSEQEVYAFLGYQYVPPELREATGELEAARAGTLPVLVEPLEVRGDLHVHTTFSDGRATLDEMVEAAIGRGYDYLAICDHSQRLRDGRLAEQAEAIVAVGERVAPFRVLRGVEVNIRADGSLDLSDEELATLDWVVASVHSGFDADITGRVLAAIENPHVDCIGHLTGRRLGAREPASVDVECAVEAAAHAGCFLEINGQPERLDLRDAHARLAGEAGVPLVVSSDAHRTEALAFLDLAVSQARRAWLTKEHVLNTRPWPEISEKLRA